MVESWIIIYNKCHKLQKKKKIEKKHSQLLVNCKWIIQITSKNSVISSKPNSIIPTKKYSNRR